jgi:hypothetical protein
MFRAQICAFVGLVLMLVAAPTGAREVQFSLENRLGGNSNVFRANEGSSIDEEPDGFWEILPRLALSDTGGDLIYQFHYQPSYEQYFTQENISGLDHAADGASTWSLSPADRLEMSGAFRSSRRLSQEIGDPGLLDPALEPSDGERVKRGEGSFAYSRQISPVLVARLGFGTTDVDYSERTRSDSRAFSTSVGATYVLNQRSTVGATLAGRWRNSRVNQEFGPVVLREIRSDSDTLDLSFLLSRRVSPSVSLTVRVGPSVIFTEQEVQPSEFASSSSTSFDDSTVDVSVFANASLQKTFRKGQANLTYMRFESGGGGSVGSTIVDDLSFQVVRRWDRLWSTRFFAGWSRRTNVGNTVGSQDTEVVGWRVIGSVARRLNEKLSLVGRFLWRRQGDEKSSGAGDRNENLIGSIALQYEFDPISF